MKDSLPIETVADSDRHILCVQCRGVFTDEETKGHWGCPRCGNQGTPADTKKTGTATLTDHEWRILTIFASNWAAQCDSKEREGGGHSNSTATVDSIVRELKRQMPDAPPLTMREEIQEVANLPGVGNVEFHHDGEVERVEPEKKQ